MRNSRNKYIGNEGLNGAVYYYRWKQKLYQKGY